MSSSLNLSNNEIGFFNDIYMLQNTGQSSIYNIFGSKTDVSNLGGMDTTTLSNITSTITGLSTLNSALATKATITSVSNINITLPSLITSSTLSSNLNNYLPLTTYNNTVLTRLNALQNDNDNNSASIIEVSITQQSILPIINNTIPSLITGISTLTSTVALKANAADVYDTIWIDETLTTKATTTSVSNLSVTVNSTITSISNINTTLPSLISWNTWNTSIFPSLGNIYGSVFLSIGSKLYIDQNTTDISKLTNTVNSTITSISDINTTLPSLISFNTWNTSIFPTLGNIYGGVFLSIGSKLYIDQNTTDISKLTNTVNSTITSISNINSTLPSLITSSTLTSNLNNYLPTANFNNTIGSYLPTANFNTTIGNYLLTTAFNNTLNSNLSLYTPLTTYNNTITTRLNAHDTSLTNINNTIPSLLLTASFNSTIGSYLPTSNFNSTIGSYLLTSAFNNTLTSNLNSYTPLATYNNTITTRLNAHDTSLTNINNTIPSLLLTASFNSTIGSYLPTTNFNSTIGSYLLTTAFNNTLTSNLNNYTPLATYNNTITTRLNGHDTSLTNINSTLPSLITSSTLSSTLTGYPAYTFDGTNNNITSGNVRYHNWISITNHSILIDNVYQTMATFKYTGSTLNSQLNIMSNLTVAGNISTSGQTHIINGTAGGSDVSLTVRNFASGTSSLYFNTNNTLSSRIWCDGLGNMNVNCYTATSFIKFYCGGTPYFQVTNAGGANVSDARFKTNVSNITNAISTITQLQGVYYTMREDTTNTQQIGFIADEVKNIVPQVVVPGTDENGDELNFMVYCRLTSLLTEGIKELNSNYVSSVSFLNTTINNNMSSISYLNAVVDNNVSSITSLTTRVSILEGN